MQVIRNKAGAIIAIDHTDEIMDYLENKRVAGPTAVEPIDPDYSPLSDPVCCAGFRI